MNETDKIPCGDAGQTSDFKKHRNLPCSPLSLKNGSLLLNLEYQSEKPKGANFLHNPPARALTVSIQILLLTLLLPLLLCQLLGLPFKPL